MNFYRDTLQWKCENQLLASPLRSDLVRVANRLRSQLNDVSEMYKWFIINQSDVQRRGRQLKHQFSKKLRSLDKFSN